MRGQKRLAQSVIFAILQFFAKFCKIAEGQRPRARGGFGRFLARSVFDRGTGIFPRARLKLKILVCSFLRDLVPLKSI